MATHSTDTTTSTRDALRQFYAAEEAYVASGGADFAPIAAAIHPDIVLRQAPSLPYGGDRHGRDAFKRFLDEFSAHWSSLEVCDVEVVEHGADRAIVLVTMTATSRRTGRVLHTPVCQTMRFRDGLLAEVRPFYWDGAAVNEVLGEGAMP